MDRKKVIIWSTVGVVSALAITFTILGIRKSVRKKREAKAKKEKDELNKLALEQSAKESEAPKETVTTGNKVTPSRDINRAINNNYNDLKGIVLYPAIKSSNAEQGHLGADGFVNVRSSPEVNNSQGIWDGWQTNLLYRVDAGTPIGTVIGEQNDNMSPPLRWFKVKLNKTYDGWFGDYSEGWVRGDAVTFKSYTKQKSFEGEKKFLEKYKTDNPLGADVFPHPNWMLPNAEEPMVGQAYDIDDVIMDL